MMELSSRRRRRRRSSAPAGDDDDQGLVSRLFRRGEVGDRFGEFSPRSGFWPFVQFWLFLLKKRVMFVFVLDLDLLNSELRFWGLECRAPKTTNRGFRKYLPKTKFLNLCVDSVWRVLAILIFLVSTKMEELIDSHDRNLNMIDAINSYIIISVVVIILVYIRNTM